MTWTYIVIPYLVRRERSAFVNEGGRGYKGLASVPEEIGKLGR